MIIFDSSTLILLAKIEMLRPFLDSARLPVAIPVEVERECCRVKKTLDALVIQMEVEDSRIQVLAVKNHKIVSRLQADFSLGSGEAEAIALAIREQSQLLGIDDKNGINASKLLGLPFTTALAILVRSREKGLLKPSDAFAKLNALAKWGGYGHSIIEDAKGKLEALK
jgi:predicted nucleic acid-binding protein